MTRKGEIWAVDAVEPYGDPGNYRMVKADDHNVSDVLFGAELRQIAVPVGGRDA